MDGSSLSLNSLFYVQSVKLQLELADKGLSALSKDKFDGVIPAS